MLPLLLCLVNYEIIQRAFVTVIKYKSPASSLSFHGSFVGPEEFM